MKPSVLFQHVKPINMQLLRVRGLTFESKVVNH